jgi:hypothetical protein
VFVLDLVSFAMGLPGSRTAPIVHPHKIGLDLPNSLIVVVWMMLQASRWQPILGANSIVE